MRYSESGLQISPNVYIPSSRSYHTIFGLFEVHYPNCSCSYCDQKKGWGRKAPGRKAWNSWWVWHAELFGVKYYLRYHSIFYKRRK